MSSELRIPVGHTHRSELIARGWSAWLITAFIAESAVAVEAPAGISNKSYPDAVIAAEEASNQQVAAAIAAAAKARKTAAAMAAALVPATGAVYTDGNTTSNAELTARGWTAGLTKRLLGEPDRRGGGSEAHALQWGTDRVSTAEATDAKLIKRLAAVAAKRGAETAARKIVYTAHLEQKLESGENLFRYVNGEWIIEGTGLVAGGTVAVTKKGGETVERVVKAVSTMVSGRQRATFGFVVPAWSAPEVSSNAPSRARSSYGRCENCGHQGRLEDKSDSSGCFGNVCGACAEQPSEVFSFA